ncbi:DUF2059 domain-containing protein [Martelella sp. AD-3]|uniref:DUF2059 domain-containing protein n=1 Tax=Martelella sp. AD-3 TaxID=686597 RepID=UPI0004B00159|nr:DUF2059 domain-containing protein [Martelella sp. AD-3]AMM84871.1 hypothetical protein AZF01_11275 [Martelella sp. AD-3]MAM12436.1 DUF2059 domain-containing protein [Rhizobiaceae bacterium]
MRFHTKIGRSVAIAATVMGLGAFSVAAAQDVSPEHLAAAKAALNALGINSQFDEILPNQADLVQSQMTQVYPNYHSLIDEVVTDTAIALAPRRADLENEGAQIYANIFTEEELQKLADFYSSDLGQKFIQYGPIAARELSQAGDIWARGIARDLNQQAQEELNARIAEQTGSAPAAE